MIGLPVLLFVPFTTVATITLTLEYPDGAPWLHQARADFHDERGAVITTISLDRAPSWGANLHWWAHSYSDQSHLRPRDMLRVTSVTVRPEGCAPQHLPLRLEARYEAASLSIHGGGLAYLLYDYKTVVKVDCRHE